MEILCINNESVEALSLIYTIGLPRNPKEENVCMVTFNLNPIVCNSNKKCGVLVQKND